jgi:hypothetical protein
MFQKLDLFPSSGEGISTLCRSLETANPNHRTNYFRKLQSYKYLKTKFIIIIIIIIIILLQLGVHQVAVDLTLIQTRKDYIER